MILYSTNEVINEETIHEECKRQCRSSILVKCMELYPEALSVADGEEYLPLHRILENRSSTIADALLMIEKYPAAVSHPNCYRDLLLHIECECRCRSSIISKCFELHPESLRQFDKWRDLPLHKLLANELSSIEDAIMMIEKYPASLNHYNNAYCQPLQIECRYRCRSSIILTAVELCPESLNGLTISYIVEKIYKNKSNFHLLSLLSIVFTASPMSLYHHYAYTTIDVMLGPTYRRRVLNLLSRHVFTSTHESDYRDLNWQPRAAMMTLLSQMKIQRGSSSIRSECSNSN
jgi:hypothetical protein